MRLTFALHIGQLSIMLTLPKTYPDLRLPTQEELRDMLKEVHRRFRKAIKKAGKTGTGKPPARK